MRSEGKKKRMFEEISKVFTTKEGFVYLGELLWYCFVRFFVTLLVFSGFLLVSISVAILFCMQGVPMISATIGMYTGVTYESELLDLCLMLIIPSLFACGFLFVFLLGMLRKLYYYFRHLVRDVLTPEKPKRKDFFGL